MYATKTQGLPAQRDSKETASIQPGDWAIVTRWTEHTVDVNRGSYRFKELVVSKQLFRGLVEMTPVTTPKFEIFTDLQGRQTGQLPRLPLYHIAQVTLLDTDGEQSYRPYADLLLDPETQNFSVEPFDELKLPPPTILHA